MLDFTQAIERLVRHIAANCAELGHVQPDRVVIAHIRTRSPGAHGVYASVLPLRFEGGESTTKRRGRTYAMPRLFRSKHGVVSAMAACSSSDLPLPQAGEGRGEGDEPAEMLYIVYFALPRFANLDFDAKLTTTFHELYHISPEFNGDIRRFPGKNYAHGHSRKRYNERVQRLAEAYVAAPGADEHAAFLRLNFDELTAQHGRVIGTRIRPPRPQPIHGRNG